MARAPALGRQVGKLKDGARSVSRTIQSNLCDGVKQEAIKLLLVGDVCTEAAAARGRTLLDNTALLGTAAPAAPPGAWRRREPALPPLAWPRRAGGGQSRAAGLCVPLRLRLGRVT